jgi:hypothetical protein
MDITDYIPNIFGQSTPTSYQNLQTLGLLSPEQVDQQRKTANIQGLLGAGLALAQGMNRYGPRRSAAENILGALAGGFGAAGGAYQQGIQNVVQQQQLQGAAMQQAQAAARLKAIQQASQQNPQLAQLFAINPEEATKQLLAMERAKMYGLGTDTTQVPAQVPAQAEIPAQVPAQVDQQGGLLAVPSFGLPSFETNVASAVPSAAAVPVPAPVPVPVATPVPTTDASSNKQPVVSLVDPANVAKANDARRKAALALSLGDEKTATFFQNEAERLDPKEQLFFRDDKLVSSKRGIVGDFSGGKVLTDDQATTLGLDPKRGKWTIKGGIPSLISGTSTVKPLTSDEAKALGLPTDRGQVYQVDSNGKIDLVQGSMVDREKYTGEYANLALTEFGTADVSKLDPTQRKALDKLAESRGISKAKAGKTDVNVYPANSMPLGKEGANKVDAQLLDLGQGRLRLQSISANFNPKYLEKPFQLKMTAVAELEKLGKKPSPQDAADLAAYSEFAQNAYSELNAYINLVTGAAVGSGDEEKRLRKGVPDPQKDSPTEFLAKLNTKIKEGRLYEARLGYIKNKGMKITDAGLVDVNQIPTMMRNREAEIKNNKTLFGGKDFDAKDPNHKAIVRSILSKEFGLVD